VNLDKPNNVGLKSYHKSNKKKRLIIKLQISLELVSFICKLFLKLHYTKKVANIFKITSSPPK